MVTDSIIKHLLCDTRSLRDYLQGQVVSFDDVKRRMLLLERAKDNEVPDHYYKLNQIKSFEGIGSIAETITTGLGRIATEYLELRETRIYVKQSMFNKWQELITYIPPMLLQVAFLHNEKPLIEITLDSCREYYTNTLYRNFKNTSLPSPYIPQLLSYINDKKGLNDLHMHLNGSTETDAVWQDMLFRPEKAHFALQNKKIKEQLEQEDATSEYFFESLLIARNIRGRLANLLLDCTDDTDACNKPEDLLRRLDSNDQSAYHPLMLLFNDNPEHPEEWMPLEALLYSIVFTKLDKCKNEGLAVLFHHYILLLGQTNRLLVQQEHQFGFQQFQKITHNDLRRNSEKDYYFRFRQLHGNDNKFISYLEGRFAPRSTSVENEILIRQINKGWKRLCEDIEGGKNTTPTLKLIAHFIKRDDDKKDPYIRHKSQRSKLYKDSQALGSLVKDKYHLMNDFVGVDAASSEFDAPPEIFAPTFRYMRHCDVQHITFHAGEDFYHILSGLRAIYEAVEFLELGCGDRIGHGTAMGVSARVWESAVGKDIYISQGEYLDNLIYVYHFAIKQKWTELSNKLHSLESKIQELNHEIYRVSFPIMTIIDAWLLRKYCPTMLFSDSLEDAIVCNTYCEKEWELADKKVPCKMRKKDKPLSLLKMYHYNGAEKNDVCNYRERYDKVIKVEIFEVINAEEIELLQKKMLELLHTKEIVIETLPTSNIRIGFHRNFDTYHLWNWIKWQREGCAIPPIVLGTDDAGIFATNIYNEYANIYCHMVHTKKWSHSEAVNIIEQIDKNGIIYRFGR